MRAKDIPDRLWPAVRKYFPDDVAQAIVGDHEEARAATVQNASCAAETPEELDATVKAIAADVDDRLADWLADGAEAPAAWLASRLRSY